MPDLADFVSPVDCQVVHGRAGLREHDKRHGTTNIADYRDQWRRAGEDRAKIFQGTMSNKERIEQTRRAYDDLRSGKVKPRRNS
jgi:hypothetical protein